MWLCGSSSRVSVKGGVEAPYRLHIVTRDLAVFGLVPSRGTIGFVQGEERLVGKWCRALDRFFSNDEQGGKTW